MIRRQLHLAAVATQLLTRLPVPVGPVEEADLRDGLGYHAAIGIAVGIVAVAVRAVAEPVLGATSATVLAVGATVAVTGALHEDGLADTVDGVWGGRSPERRLEIMHDSRLGTYGALALSLALLLRVSLLAPLPLGVFLRAVLAGEVLGRASGAVLATISAPPAAAPGGLGSRVVGGSARWSVLVPMIVIAGAVSVAAVGGWAVLLVVLCGAAVLSTRHVARRSLGGVTGDVLGAANQVANLVVLCSVVGLHRTGVLG